MYCGGQGSSSILPDIICPRGPRARHPRHPQYSHHKFDNFSSKKATVYFRQVLLQDLGRGLGLAGLPWVPQNAATKCNYPSLFVAGRNTRIPGRETLISRRPGILVVRGGRSLKSFLPQACNHRFARSVFRFCLFIFFIYFFMQITPYKASEATVV